jgi:thiamine biosynthesis protein ThiS
MGGTQNMQIMVNGTRQEAPSDINVSQLLVKLNFLPERVAVEVNLAIIDRGKYGQTLLSEGDQIEIISFVGGGSECHKTDH